MPTIDQLLKPTTTRTFTRKQVDIGNNDLIDVTVTYKLGMMDIARTLDIDNWIFTVCTDIGLRNSDGTPVPVTRESFKQKAEELREQMRPVLVAEQERTKNDILAAGGEWNDETAAQLIEIQLMAVEYPPNYYKWAIHWLVMEDVSPKRMISQG